MSVKPLLWESGMQELSIDGEMRDSLAELSHLEHAIGKTGVLALRPLIMRPARTSGS
jgi:hypothetical protein